MAKAKKPEVGDEVKNADGSVAVAVGTPEGKGEMPEGGEQETETVVAQLVTDHGTCKDCGEVVRVMVDPWQVSGDGSVRCVQCRITRMKEKHLNEIATLTEKAKLASEAAAQGVLRFPKSD